MAFFNKELLILKRVITLYIAIFLNLIAIRGQENMPVKQEIQFISGGELLYGQIILPDTVHKVPLLVFLSGSGSSSSYRTNYAGFLKFFFEGQLPDNGIGLMYFDKRGVGKSTGKWYKTGFYDRAADAVAAIDYACSTGLIDPHRICIAGHSQGGWIAQIVAAEYPEKVSCMVSMSGATFSVFRQLVNDYQSEYICRGKDSIPAHRKAVRRARFTLWSARLFPVTPNMKQLKLIMDFDPGKELRKISVPSLFTFAENDELVYPAWSMDALHKLFSYGLPENLTVKTFPGTDHGYRIAKFCSRNSRKKGPASVEVRNFLTEWIVRNLKGYPEGG